MKGILKSFEVLVAILFVLVAYFSLFRTEEKIPDVEIVIWKIRGFEALKVLDDSNKLANYALANESEKIEDALTELLPIGLDYKVLICEQTCPTINFKSEKVVSVSYFVQAM